MASVLITGFISDAEAQEFINWMLSIGYACEGRDDEGMRPSIWCNMKKTYPLHVDEHGNHVMDVSDDE